MRGERYLPYLPPAAAVLAFLPVLRNDFVNHEDYWMIVHNPHLARLSWGELRWMLTSFDYGSYHPLGWLLLALLRAAFGLSPMAHHAAGLALHAGSAYLLFKILETLLKGERPAAAAAAASLWAVHPLQLEMVGWAVELPDMMAVTLALGSALAYLKGKLPAGVILFALSLLARWKAVALPVGLVLLELRQPKRLVRTLPFFALGALFAWLNAQAKTAGPGHALGLGPEFAAGALFYLGKALYPADLTLDYALAGSAAHTAVFLGLTGAAVYLRKRAPALPAAWTLYLAALAPTLLVSYYGIFTAHDRFFYVPSLALAGLAAWALARAKWAIPLAAGGMMLLVATTRHQIPAWRDSVSLWTHVLSRPGAPPYARLSLAFGLMERGRHAEAEAALREHLALYPDDRKAARALTELRARPR